MNQLQYWLAQKVNGKEILICQMPSLKKAKSYSEKWKDKGHYVVIKNRYATRKKI